MANNVPITSFNGGAASPKVDERIDTEKYQSLCRTLDNFIPEKYGCCSRRPGTIFIVDITEDA
jgi:hypothetical protein